MTLDGLSVEHAGLRYYYEVAHTLTRSDAMRILKWECEKNALYEEAWAEAQYLYYLRRQQHPSHTWYLMKKEYFVAIMCYMLKTPNISSFFDEWCRAAMPTQESWQNFPLKSLFFFLIKAFDYLPPHSIDQVYRADPRFPVNRRKKVHFVQFLSASTYIHQALKFGNRFYVLVLMDIPAPLLRDVSMYSSFPKCKEVIIWPFCVFKVVAEQYSMKTLMFDPKRSFTEPRPQIFVPRVTTGPLAAYKRSRRRAEDETSTSSAVSDVDSALVHVTNSRRATEEDEETKTAAVHSTPGTSGTELSATDRDEPETPAAAQPTLKRTASMERLRKIIDEIRRDFIITFPRHELTDIPDKSPASGGPVLGAGKMHATSSNGSFAAAWGQGNADKTDRSQETALSGGDDKDVDLVVSWKRILAVVCIILAVISSGVIILNKFAF